MVWYERETRSGSSEHRDRNPGTVSAQFPCVATISGATASGPRFRKGGSQGTERTRNPSNEGKVPDPAPLGTVISEKPARGDARSCGHQGDDRTHQVRYP